MKRQLENFYFNLGYRTKLNLHKVRGLKKEQRNWDAFIALPDTQRVFHDRKMTKKDIQEFEAGFKYNPPNEDLTTPVSGHTEAPRGVA